MYCYSRSLLVKVRKFCCKSKTSRFNKQIRISDFIKANDKLKKFNNKVTLNKIKYVLVKNELNKKIW